MNNKGVLPLLAVLFAVIILGGTAMLGASTPSDDKQVFEHDSSLVAVAEEWERDHGDWLAELNRVLPEERREELMKENLSDLTATQEFSRGFFAHVIKEHHTGGNVDNTEAYRFIVEHIQNRSDVQNLNEHPFSRDDVSVINDYDRDDIFSYGMEMGEIIFKHSPETEHELILLEQAFQGKNRHSIVELKRIAEGYRNITQDALEVTVPESAADLHIDVLNTLKRSERGVSAMAEILDDPMFAIIGLEAYMDNAEVAPEVFISVYEYFGEHGVVYGPTEVGSAYSFELEKVDE